MDEGEDRVNDEKSFGCDEGQTSGEEVVVGATIPLCRKDSFGRAGG